MIVTDFDIARAGRSQIDLVDATRDNELDWFLMVQGCCWCAALPINGTDLGQLNGLKYAARSGQILSSKWEGE